MEQKECWKDFRKLVKNRPEYRQWLHCKDPEEKALRLELLRLLVRFDSRADEAKKLPMPTEMTDVYLTRASLHVDQNMAFYHFVETLFENFIRNKEDGNMNVLFSFLDMYIMLLEREIEWAQNRNPAG